MPGQAVEDESRTGHEPPPESGGGEEKPAPHETNLLLALRRFVRHAANQPEPPDEEPSEPEIKPWQIAVLLVVVLDMVLLYSEFEEWFENPLFAQALKVVPWLLGATAFAYSEKIRKWILGLCKRPVVAVFAILIALPLLIVRQSIFSVVVSVDPDTVSVQPADPKDKLDVSAPEEKLFRVVLPDLLKPYRITVKDTAIEHSTEGTTGRSEPFSPLLPRARVLRGTLAQVPLIGRLFGQAQMKLTPLYEVPTHSSKEGAHAMIEGTFEEGYQEYLLQTPPAERVCSRRATESGHNQIWCTIDDGDGALFLPPGKYKFTLSRDTCQGQLGEREIRRAANELIDIDKLCAQ